MRGELPSRSVPAPNQEGENASHAFDGERPFPNEDFVHRSPATAEEFHRFAMHWGAWGKVSAPIPMDEGERLRALASYGAFETPPEESFDRLTRLVARTMRVPTALVSLVGADRQWLKSCVGLPGVQETGRDVAFCAHTILRDDVMVVPDATKDPRFCDNPLVTGWPHIRFYMGMPLRTPSGHNVGSLCAIDTAPREPSEEDCETMRELASLVVDELELRKALRAMEAQKELVEAAEEHYRHLAESVQGMVFQAVQRGPRHFAYEYVSVGSMELLGLFPEQIIEDREMFLRRFHPEDLPNAYQKISDALESGEPWHWEGRAVVWGEEKWIRGSARGTLCPDGSTRWRGLMVDITEAKAREAALAEAKAEAERASRAKGEFFSRMSHELRTPLNAILGFAQTLATEDLVPEARDDVAEIDRAGRHLLSLINDVLDLAAVEAQPPAVDSVSVCDVLKEVYGLLRPLLDERGIRLRAVHRCGDAHVVADRGRIKQALINLMTNAIKYSRAGGHVRVATSPDDAGQVAIAISDQGSGIATEHLARLFTPFDRLGAEATDVQGTGLGLAITQGLVEAMGGTLVVASEVGVGTTFTVLLPTDGAFAVAA